MASIYQPALPPSSTNTNDYGFQRLTNIQRRRMTGTTTSCVETRFTFLLKPTQPLAKGRERYAEAATHFTRVAFRSGAYGAALQ